MFSTRSIRLVVTIVALVTVVAIIVLSHGQINSQVAKMKDKQQNAVPEEEVSNTLQGKPHKGTEAPYSQGNHPGSTKGSKPIIADTSDSEKAHADKNKAAGADAADIYVPPVADSGLTNVEPDSGVSTSKQPPTQKPSGKEGCSDQEYVIMIDAGSTGSRVHIYQFDTCTAPPRLIKETFEKLEPGLSSFDTDSKGAAASLNGLLDLALKTVPANRHGCTPVAVKATAGLRLLGEEKSTNILKEVRNHIENDYPFAVVNGDGISIMDGKDEGVYAWITTNYLLGNIGAEEKMPTAAVFDLGGGSTQIVFEPEFSSSQKMLDGDHKYTLTFGDKEYKLYQYSHLGFGLMEGRNKINALVVKANLKNNADLSKAKFSDKESAKLAKASVTLSNVCVPVGVTAENVLVKVSNDEYYVVNMQGPKEATTGAQCRALAETVLNKETDCAEKPCSFNGIYQPSLTRSFSKLNDMFIFSFFYDRTNPLGFPSSFTVEELTELAKVVCGGDKFWSEVLLDDHVKQLQEEPQWCLDLSFITAMLHTGYEIPLHRELRTARKIADNEVGWCLGASLPLLDKSSGWSCRIAETSGSR